MQGPTLTVRTVVEEEALAVRCEVGIDFASRELAAYLAGQLGERREAA